MPNSRLPNSQLPNSQLPKSQLTGRRVLLVEDETLLAMLIEEALADLGCEVVGPAGRLEAAERLIDTERVDCALIDINLRGRPAYPLAERLDARGVPFALVTGYDTADIQPRYRRGHPILRKPIAPGQLEAVLVGMTRSEKETKDDKRPPRRGIRR